MPQRNSWENFCCKADSHCRNCAGIYRVEDPRKQFWLEVTEIVCLSLSSSIHVLIFHANVRVLTNHVKVHVLTYRAKVRFDNLLYIDAEHLPEKPYKHVCIHVISFCTKSWGSISYKILRISTTSNCIHFIVKNLKLWEKNAVSRIQSSQHTGADDEGCNNFHPKMFPNIFFFFY